MRYLIVILASWILVGCGGGATYKYNYSVISQNALTDKVYYRFFQNLITDKEKQLAIETCKADSGDLKDACLLERYHDENRMFVNVFAQNREKYLRDNKFAEEYLRKKEIDRKETLRVDLEKYQREEKRREDEQKRIELEALEKNYGKKCFVKKTNINEYNKCLYEQQKIAFAEIIEKQEQERKINKAKLEEQKRLANLPPSERYAYTCEKTYGFRKGTDNFKECVFKIMTTEYEMQNQLNQRRIAELERKVASNQANTAYQNEMLEIERMKAKAMQDQVNFAKNKDITDTLLGISNNLLNPPRRPAPNAPQMFNCQTRKFGGFDQIQCF